MLTEKDLDVFLVEPIVIHRCYYRLLGDLKAASMLAQAVYWTRKTYAERQGWFYKTREQWLEEACVTRFEQERARTLLRKYDFWHEDLRGVPAQLWFKVDCGKLAEALSSLSAGKQPTGVSKELTDNAPVGGKPANKKAEKAPTSLTKRRQQVGGKGANIPKLTTKNTSEISAGGGSTALKCRVCSREDKRGYRVDFKTRLCAACAGFIREGREVEFA